MRRAKPRQRHMLRNRQCFEWENRAVGEVDMLEVVEMVQIVGTEEIVEIEEIEEIEERR